MLKEWVEEWGLEDINFTFTGNEENILRYWKKNKSFLKKMFGGELILEKPVTYKKSNKQLERELQNGDNTAYWDFRNEVRNKINATYLDFKDPLSNLYYEIVVDSDVLASNVYNGPSFEVALPDGKELKVMKGMKAMRVLGKFAKAYGIESFEAFRLYHSSLLNDRNLHGTLCLSIHPMDYLTMSDNENKWSSCMSWSNFGLYRGGTIECMNSEYVVVAYLKSETAELPNGWNSKKWRSLFIVDKNVITSIKNYPFESPELTLAALEWLRELSPYTYGDPVKYTYFACSLAEGENFSRHIKFRCSGTMYCDFGTCAHYGCFSETENYTIDYSGPLTCMNCGEVFSSDEGSDVLCRDCSELKDCCSCGALGFRDNMTYLPVYNSYICSYCLRHDTQECAISGATFLTKDATFFPIESDGVWVGNDYLDDANYFEIDDNGETVLTLEGKEKLKN